MLAIKYFCCGEIGHYKLNCPSSREERCSYCQKIGHTTRVCKATVIRDNQQRVQGIVAQTKKKLQIIVERNETSQRKFVNWAIKDSFPKVLRRKNSHVTYI